MKHLVNIIVIFLLIFSVCLAERPAEESLTAKSCILVDAYTGEVLYEKNADERMYPASTTKILTLLLSIEQKDGSEIVTVPECAGDITLDSTRVPVYFGEVMPLRDLWYGLIYNSGNDAANAIAELTAGSIDAFVEQMNSRAQELGMTNSHFANAHGLHDPKHYTTARDLATLTCYALDIDLFREITLSQYYTMQPTALRDELEINHLYAICDYTTTYYYRYARGLKTGYTQKAGQCYVGEAYKDGKELVVVIMNAGGTKPEKWVDAKRLFEYGFEVLESR